MPRLWRRLSISGSHLSKTSQQTPSAAERGEWLAGQAALLRRVGAAVQDLSLALWWNATNEDGFGSQAVQLGRALGCLQPDKLRALDLHLVPAWAANFPALLPRLSRLARLQLCCWRDDEDASLVPSLLALTQLTSLTLLAPALEGSEQLTALRALRELALRTAGCDLLAPPPSAFSHLQLCLLDVEEEGDVLAVVPLASTSTLVRAGTLMPGLAGLVSGRLCRPGTSA
ncbi:hypothetical protein ABPG75_005527 [Micractinium tetrahymenae]